ncbi:hypothetical protein JQC91_03320 [Jannaschia sp. Os4]|uniref:DUF6678 family protein n=1 Tax=Jannaschia sp. Os4 TaxID=2807617 RepID=UPI00193A6FC0|nr:DUF6678 family protein [Jannaschia sp. Os4]MBM2575326.1 hypothetical protein [Jannaschia sp. Os4]
MGLLSGRSGHFERYGVRVCYFLKETFWACPMTVHDPRSTGRLARRLFSAAHMSDTKWRKLFEAVSEAANVYPMTVKFIDVPEVKKLRFPPSLHCSWPYIDTIEFGPTELRAIEWLEFNADLTELFEGGERFPSQVMNGVTRVIGYSNPSAS